MCTRLSHSPACLCGRILDVTPACAAPAAAQNLAWVQDSFWIEYELDGGYPEGAVTTPALPQRITQRLRRVFQRIQQHIVG